MSNEYNNLKNEIINVIKNHPLLVIFNLPLSIGGSIIIIYLLHIEFFPIVSTSDIMLLLLFTFAVGIGLLLFLSLVMIFPVIQYQQCKGLIDLESKLEQKCLDDRKSSIKKESKSKNIMVFIFNKLSVIFISKCQEKNEEVLCNPQRALLFFPLMINLLIVIGLFYAFSYFHLDGYGIILFMFYLMMITIIALCIFYFQLKKIEDIKIFQLFKKELFYTYLKSIYTSTFFIFLAFYILLSLLSNSDVLKENEFLLFSYSFVFIMFFTIICVLQKNLLKQLLITMIVFITLSFLPKVQYVIPSAIMKMFTIGQVDMEKIILKKEACKTFDIDFEKDFCEKKNMKLLWRIGEEYFFSEIIKINNDEFEQKYYISKSHIISMMKTTKITKKDSK